MFKKFSAISGELYYGPMPTFETLKKLESLGINIIWNLGAELQECYNLEKAMFDTVFSEIPDFSIPPNKNRFLTELNIICENLRAGKKVFVHCLGGRGRTGMALAAVALQLNGLSSFEALNAAKGACNGPETENQKEFIRSL